MQVKFVEVYSTRQQTLTKEFKLHDFSNFSRSTHDLHNVLFSMCIKCIHINPLVTYLNYAIC